MGNNQKNKVRMIVLSYTHRVREQINKICVDYFAGTWAEKHVKTIYTCIDELIKNAFKANYKFYLVLEEVKLKLREANPLDSDQGINRRMQALIRNKIEFDKICDEIFSETDLGEKVREILDEESVFLDLKNLAFREQRSNTEQELSRINDLSKLQDIRKLLKANNVDVKFSIEADEVGIFIDVTNTAPIMTKDLERIYEKRREFFRYYLNGEGHEFFINNIDTSDAGFGLGFAVIDSFLASLGVDLESSMAIISEENTIIMLILPNQLQPREAVLEA